MHKNNDLKNDIFDLEKLIYKKNDEIENFKKILEWN